MEAITPWYEDTNTRSNLLGVSEYDWGKVCYQLVGDGASSGFP